MPFIGTQPEVGGYSVLDALTASATASYTLQLNSANFSPSSANQLLVSLNGVIQKPGSSFTVSGSTLTFSSALDSSDSIDFILAMGEPLLVGTPSDGTVNADKLATNAVTTAKIANDAITDVKLATDSVGTDAIGTGVVGTTQLAASAVTNAKLADDAITTANMNASLVTHIDAGSTKAQGVTTSYADTNLSGSITIPTGCTKIMWFMRGGYRQNGIGRNHTAVRLKFVRSGVTTYVGHGSWGMGIHMQVGSTAPAQNHSHWTLYANLLDFDTDNNQANLIAGNTYAVTIQVKDSSANGSNLYIFGDTTSNATYYPAFMSFMFF